MSKIYIYIFFKSIENEKINNITVPHFEPPVNLTASTCNAVACDFESGDCMEKLEDAGFETSDERVGPMSSGVRLPLGKYNLSRSFKQILACFTLL